MMPLSKQNSGQLGQMSESIISPSALLGHFFPFMSPKVVSSGLVRSALAAGVYWIDSTGWQTWFLPLITQRTPSR